MIVLPGYPKQGHALCDRTQVLDAHRTREEPGPGVMMGLMDLIEFMTARLDEEESAAKAHEGEPYADRVMATVAAHRRILERATSEEVDEGDMCAVAAFHEAEHIVCLLAQVYANHPEYREEWKP